jgi:hypothetical protein
LGDGIVVELPSSASGVFKHGAEVCAFSHSADAVLLTREGSNSTGYFAGSIESMSIGEVMGQIVAGMRTGKLIVGLGAIRKTVSFRDGQVVFATSSQQHERLGVLLARLKLVSPEQLKEGLTKVRPGRRLGQVLTQSGVVTPNNLYGAMTFLVREIVVSLFELNEGGFLFLDGIPASEDSLKLPERTRNILLVGLQRGAEMEALRRKLPWTLRVTAGPKPAPPGSEGLFARVGEGRDLLVLRQFFDGGEHAFLSSVDELLQSGCLTSQAQPAAPSAKVPAETRSPLDLYATLIRSVCQALKSAGHDLKDLQSFFVDPLPGMEEPFAGVTLSDEGYLDFDQVMNNMKGPTSALRRAKAYEALDGFLAYALFSAKNVMSPDMAESLADEFRRIQGELGG